MTPNRTPSTNENTRPTATTLALLTSLYCAQGLPSGLIAHAMPVLLRQNQVDLALIGLLKLLALPWLLKALWAPWVDRLASPRLGHHRGWILPLQLTVITCMMLLAAIDPAALFGTSMYVLLGLLLVINLAAATQDIATDGLTVRLLPERWRGLGNSLQVGGYKVGMIISGSGLLLCVDALGWNVSILIIGVLLILLTVPILRFDEAKQLPRLETKVEETRGLSLLLVHYRGLMAQPGMWWWLLVVLTFKLGDSLGSPMIKPMLVDQAWSSAQLGQLTLISSVAGIGGALLGGLLYARLGAQHSLLLCGGLQAIGIAAMAYLIGNADDTLLVYSVALFEQIADGMSTVALFAVMMRQCRPEHEGADFTLQASAALLLAGLVGSTSGVLAKNFGYGLVFTGSGALGIVVLALVVNYFLRHSKPATQ
jgi:MFS family permease